MMYGKKNSVTDVRLVSDETWFDVCFHDIDTKPYVVIVYYGCHRSYQLNEADKEYSSVLKAASEWLESMPKDGVPYMAECCLTKYYKRSSTLPRSFVKYRDKTVGIG